MKKLSFNLAAVLLMAVIVIGMVNVLFTGEGTFLYLKNAAAAAANSENVGIMGLPVPTAKAALDYDPYAPRELTADTFDHIYLDGVKYDFPLHLNQLPEEFSWHYFGVSENNAPNGKKYNYAIRLYYNNIGWALGYYEHDTENYFPEDVVVTSLVFGIFDQNEYMPEILVGGFDVFNTDFKAVNKLFGSDRDDYAFTNFCVPADDGAGYFRISVFDTQNKISRFMYFDEPYTTKMQGMVLYDDEMEIRLPENYSIETDEVNNALTAAPLPESEEEMQAALGNMRISGIAVKLPCTLNALMYTLNDEYIYAEYRCTDGFFDDFGVQKFDGRIKYDGSTLSFSAILRPGQSFGDAQIVELSSDNITFENITASNEDDAELIYDDVYSFTSGPGTYNTEMIFYYLTDYKYNNVCCTPSRSLINATISYWPENTELKEQAEPVQE